MLNTEFVMEDAIAVWKEEGFEEGFANGEAKGREEALSAIIPKLKELGLSAEDIVKATGLKVNEAAAYYEV